MKFVDLVDENGRRLLLNPAHIIAVLIGPRRDQFSMRIEISVVDGRDSINWTGTPEEGVQIVAEIQGLA